MMYYIFGEVFWLQSTQKANDAEVIYLAIGLFAGYRKYSIHSAEHFRFPKL